MFQRKLYIFQADQKVLQHLTSQYLPEVAATLKEHDIELGLISLQWFLTLFAGVIHMKLLLPVWDQFFYNGSIVMFKVSDTLARD